jgi:hypothetical protein
MRPRTDLDALGKGNPLSGIGLQNVSAEEMFTGFICCMK